MLSTKYNLYDADLFKTFKEAQLEDAFIKPLFTLLGWVFHVQPTMTIQGLSKNPDYALFIEDDKEKYLALPETEHKEDFSYIKVLCDAKEYNQILDTNKADKTKNPHVQLVEYLLYGRPVQYSFLTNGREWVLYDIEHSRATKNRIVIDLEGIIHAQDFTAFAVFYTLFSVSFYKKAETKKKELLIDIIQEEERTARIRVEEDLRKMILGENSIFEQIGKALYSTQPTDDLHVIFENSTYFVFRLLFIAYFEDNFSDTIAQHKQYKNHSLNTLFEMLNTVDPKDFEGWSKIKDLFAMLDKGNKDFDIPLLNGGLFSPQKAPMLLEAKILNNESLQSILYGILFMHGENSMYRRDFSSLNIKHLGSIYEGLLEWSLE